MTCLSDKFRRIALGVVPVRPIAPPSTPNRRFTSRLKRVSSGIGFKLALLIVILLTLTTSGISLAVIGVMDDVQLKSMLRRGSSIAHAAASQAGYSILAEDRLALDNLVARISATQPDLDSIAIVNNKGTILAHNRLELTGEAYRSRQGVPIGNDLGLEVRKVRTGKDWAFEFTIPITFSGNDVGRVVSSLSATSLEQAKNSARGKILLIVGLLLPIAVAGALLLSRLFTDPVSRLADGVARIRSGEHRVIVPVTSNDELADLTRSFNEMSKTIVAQRQSLINYSEELESSYADIVRILAAALDARDNYTYGHSSRVAELSVAAGRRLGLQPYELKDLEMTCMLHDIGKIRIPDVILNKPARLDAEEYRHIREHPVHGARILELARSLEKYIPAVRHHHEWHDGSGYPDGLSGDDIPLYARILCIADAYDAMTSSRPYRQGLSRQQAVTELVRFKGKQFDPVLVDLFIASLEGYSDICDLPLTGSAG